MSTTTARVVLVVEDEPSLHELMLELFAEHGYKGQVATSSGRALQALEEGLPALVLLDMDGVADDGEVLAKEMRARYGARLPLVVVGQRYEAQTLAERVGADGWLEKPFDIDRFVSVVDEFAKG